MHVCVCVCVCVGVCNTKTSIIGGIKYIKHVREFKRHRKYLHSLLS